MKVWRPPTETLKAQARVQCLLSVQDSDAGLGPRGVVEKKSGIWAGLGEGTLTGPRLQGQDQDQGTDHQVQAVEGPFPVPVFLVWVHEGDGEEQQELHGQLSGLRSGKVSPGRPVSGRAAPRAPFLERAAMVPVSGPNGCCDPWPHRRSRSPQTCPSGSGGQSSKIKVLAGPCAFCMLEEETCPVLSSSEGLPAFLQPVSL